MSHTEHHASWRRHHQPTTQQCGRRKMTLVALIHYTPISQYRTACPVAFRRKRRHPSTMCSPIFRSFLDYTLQKLSLTIPRRNRHGRCTSYLSSTSGRVSRGFLRIACWLLCGMMYTVLTMTCPENLLRKKSAVCDKRPSPSVLKTKAS